MSIIKCPTNCDHDFMFPHSVVTATRVIGRELRVTEYVTCRACGHWIDGRYPSCKCRFRCHDEEGGMYVLTSNDDVN